MHHPLSSTRFDRALAAPHMVRLGRSSISGCNETNESDRKEVFAVFRGTAVNPDGVRIICLAMAFATALMSRSFSILRLQSSFAKVGSAVDIGSKGMDGSIPRDTVLYLSSPNGSSAGRSDVVEIAEPVIIAWTLQI